MSDMTKNEEETNLEVHEAQLTMMSFHLEKAKRERDRLRATLKDLLTIIEEALRD